MLRQGKLQVEARIHLLSTHTTIMPMCLICLRWPNYIQQLNSSLVRERGKITVVCSGSPQKIRACHFALSFAADCKEIYRNLHHTFRRGCVRNESLFKGERAGVNGGRPCSNSPLFEAHFFATLDPLPPPPFV